MQKRYLSGPARVLFLLLVTIAVAATLLPFLPSKVWYVRIFDYPRLQTLIVAILAFAWYQSFYFKRGRRGYIIAVALLLVIGVQAYKAWPYTPLSKKQVLDASPSSNDSSSIGLYICNVLQTNTAYAQVVQAVRRYRPDVVITTESDSAWQNGLAGLHADYPYRVAVPKSNTYGMHLYSRLPLRQSAVRYLLEPDIPSIRTGLQLPSGEWITLFVMHPRPPVPGESSDSRERDAEIITVAREAKPLRGGVIVAGDFNDVAWSETTQLFQEVSGYLDPRRGRGFYNTFHAKYPVFRWPLDHIFHSSHFTLRRIERADAVNSDHFPMYIHLAYEPEKKAAQPAVKPDEETGEKAAETIRKGKNDADAPGE